MSPPGRPKGECSRLAGWSGGFAEHRSAPTERAGCAKPALRSDCFAGLNILHASLLAMSAKPALRSDCFAEHRSAPAERAGCAKPALRRAAPRVPL